MDRKTDALETLSLVSEDYLTPWTQKHPEFMLDVEQCELKPMGKVYRRLDVDWHYAVLMYTVYMGIWGVDHAVYMYTVYTVITITCIIYGV